MKILLELPISVNTAGLYYRDKTPLLRTPYTLHSRSWGKICQLISLWARSNIERRRALRTMLPTRRSYA